MNWMVTSLVIWIGFGALPPILVGSDQYREDDINQSERVSCRSRETYELAYVEERAFWGYGGNLSGP